MNKQTQNIIWLLVLVGILAVVAVFTFKGSGGGPSGPTPAPSPAPQAAQTPAAPGAPDATTAPGEKTASTGKLRWLQQPGQAKGPALVSSMRGGRDPFAKSDSGGTVGDIPTPSKPPTPLPIPKPTLGASGPIGPGNPLPPFPTTLGTPQLEQRMEKVLLWITPHMLAQIFTLQKLEVTLIAGKKPGAVIITGYAPDFDKAVALTTQLDVPPPVPNFTLMGVVLSGAERYAAITVDGAYYTVMEGDRIPRLGWMVIAISSESVRLKKGKQTVQLRLSGGNPS